MIILASIGKFSANTEEQFHEALKKIEGYDRVFVIPPQASIQEALNRIALWGKSYEEKQRV